MTSTQTKLLVFLLLVIGVTLPFFLLVWGEQTEAVMACGTGEECTEETIPVLVDEERHGLWSPFGLIGILLGIFVPMVLLAGAALFAIGPKGWGVKR